MKVFEYADRINKLNKLILNGCTGTPEEFAYQLGISRTSLYELIDELKLRNAPIEYSKKAKTFYYSKPFEISIICNLRPISYEDEKNFSGGNYFSKILFSRTMPSEISVVTLPC